MRKEKNDEEQVQSVQLVTQDILTNAKLDQLLHISTAIYQKLFSQDNPEQEQDKK